MDLANGELQWMESYAGDALDRFENCLNKLEVITGDLYTMYQMNGNDIDVFVQHCKCYCKSFASFKLVIDSYVAPIL